MADTPVGTPVTLNIDRDGKKMDFKVVVADRMEVYADDPNIAGRKADSESDTPYGADAARRPGEVKFGIQRAPGERGRARSDAG